MKERLMNIDSEGTVFYHRMPNDDPMAEVTKSFFCNGCGSSDLVYEIFYDSRGNGDGCTLCHRCLQTMADYLDKK